MIRRAFVLLALSGIAAGGAWGHLCNNIYRTPDRIIVKPEKDELLLENQDEVRIFVRNNYPTRLYNTRLTADTGDNRVQAIVEPEVIEEMVPGEKAQFTVTVQADKGAPQGKYNLSLSIQADNFGFRPVQEATDEELIRYFGEGNVSSHVLVAESLARRGHPEGIRRLTDLINGEAGREYKIRAIRCVGRSGNENLVSLLLPLLKERDGAVKGNALLALGMLRTGADRIQPFLQDRDPFVCACAATALLMMDRAPEGVVSELAQPRFLQNESPYVQVAAAWGVVWAGHTEPLRILDEAVHTWDAELVVFAGDALLCLADQQEKKQQPDAAPTVEPQASPTPRAEAMGSPQALAALSPDRLFFNVVPPLPTASEGGDLWIQLYHSYPAPLHEVRVRAQGQGVSGVSEEVASIAPTELGRVRVPLQKDDEASGDLTLTVEAAELREPATLSVAIPTTLDEKDAMERAIAMPVGSLPIHVMKLGDLYAFAWGVPLAAALGATLWLSIRRAGKREAAA